MSVRQSLLAILDQGPCYGYQLRAEFDRRTGSTWPLNVGQIYNTLERLERDGLVQKGEIDEQGHVYYEITDAGRAEVADWLASPVERGQGTRDELPIKLALAATLPGVDAGEVLRRQRVASVARLDALTAEAAQRDAGHRPDAELVARRLVLDSLIFRAEAEVRWLDDARSRLEQHSPHSLGVQINPEKPRRGRPPRAQSGLTSPSAAAPMSAPAVG